MALTEKCAEQLSAVAFGAGSVALTLGGPTSLLAAVGTAAVPAMVGVGALIGIAAAAAQRHGPESKKALEAIRKRIERDWRKAPGFEAASEADLEKASEELYWNLKDCMLDRAALARTATDPRGFPEAATDLVLAALGGRNGVFLPDGEHPMANATARNFARAVVGAAFHAAMENRDWFEKFEPLLQLEIARALGETREVVIETREAIKRLATTQQLDAQTERLLQAFERSKEGVARDDALVAFARRIGREAADPDQALRELQAAFQVYQETLAQGARPHNLNAYVDAVLKRLAEKTKAGDIDGAAREANAAIDQWERGEAERREAGIRAGVALLEAGVRQDTLARNAVGVADKIVRMLKLNPDQLFERIRAFQDAYYVSGRDRGINFNLEIAIQLAERSMSAAAGADERGNAANDLAMALQILGERESGTERLEEAAATYRLALDEWTRERAPRNWAMTQSNLGAALSALGKRESGTGRLENAVAAFRLALEERKRENAPLSWAATHNNLGAALTALGQREGGTARLEEAVAAYRLALKEWTRERVPLDWAMTHNNLGAALTTLGQRENGTARLEEAVAAYRLALEESTRDRAPLDWAGTQNNLGDALAALGERESGTERLKEAIAAYRLALEEWTRERVPPDWAGTQNNLGAALAVLGERESGTERLEEAVAAYQLALEERTRDRAPLEWATSQSNLGQIVELLGDRGGGAARWSEAAAHYEGALSVFTETSGYAGRARKYLDRVRAKLATG